MKKIYSILFVITILAEMSAQSSMNEGFKMLETGQFANARTFFEKILSTEPNNKTAQLCYGRAMGLSGQPAEASQLFLKMLEKNSTDYELKLNYGESLLWNKNYIDAKNYYINLVKEDPKSFPANLGLANSFSNLSIFDSAELYINKALLIEPKNDNAKISKKYILLGSGFDLSQKNKTQEAYQKINQIFEFFPKDEQALWTLCNIATASKDFKMVENTLVQLNPTAVNNIKIVNQKSLLAHLKAKNKKANDLAIENYTNTDKNLSKELSNMVDERYVQSLIWNNEFTKAQSVLEKIKVAYPTEIFPLSLEATLGMYMSKFDVAVSSYNKILAKDSSSFDGNLGIANAYFAKNEMKLATEYGEKAASYYPFQTDIKSFNRKVTMYHSPEINLKNSYSIDLGKDEAFTYNAKLKIPISYKFQFLVGGIRRETRNVPQATFATLTHGNIGFNWIIKPNLQYTFSTGLINTNTNLLHPVNNVMVNTKLTYKPNPFHNIELGFGQELQDFNTSLIQKNIRMDHYMINYNLSTLKKIGFFGQLYHSRFSDANTRNLLFTSLYYTILPQPILKTGINYQHISFGESKPNDYFSPSYFNLGEVFIQMIKEDNSSLRNQWIGEFTAAGGYQFIENNSAQTAYRLYGELGAKLNYQWIITAYGMYNNIASATAAGFKYSEIGIKLKFNLNKKVF